MEKYIVLSANLKIDYFYTLKNNRFQNRASGYIELIQDLKPDFIGFQEYQKQMKESFTVLDTFYDNYVCECGNTLTKQCNAIYYLKEKYTLIEKGTYWLSLYPDVKNSAFLTFEPRNLVWATLLDKQTNKTLFLASTHLDFSNPLTRLFQLKTISNILSKHKKDICILLGDFNATYKSVEISSFLKNTPFKLNDVMSSFRQPTIEFPSFFPKHSGPIDHIFISDNVSILDAKILSNKKQDISFSDHHPISCIFTLR